MDDYPESSLKKEDYMPLILETKSFVLSSHDQPHHCATNGGHLKITPKNKYEHRWQMSVDEAVEMEILSMILGEAAMKLMASEGLEPVRINFQDNGNWAYKPEYNLQPFVHLHLYIRTKNEKHPDNDPKFQAFPEALVFPPRESGYYDKFQPVSEEVCAKIRDEFLIIAGNEKYKDIIKLYA